jgi:hypothetical protein
MSNDAARLAPNLLERGLDYWDSKRAGRRMPRRRDIDPLEIPQLLSHVVLIDVLRDPLDFRYRLIGTAITARMGRDCTGEILSAQPHHGEGSAAWKSLVRILDEKRPIVSHVAYVGINPWVSRYRDISMPLSEDDDAVNMIFGVLQFDMF